MTGRILIQVNGEKVRQIKQAVRPVVAPPHSAPPLTLTFDLLTLKVVSESRVTWATSVPNLVFLGLSFLVLGHENACTRQTSDAHRRLMPPTRRGGA